MGALLSLFSKEVTTDTELVPLGGGLLNALRNSWRGLLASLLAVIIFSVFCRGVKESPDTLKGIWLTMFMLMLVRPMDVAASALILLFAPSLLGILPTEDCCSSLANDNVILFFLGGWLLLLVNNCGLDKRMACAFLAAGKTGTFTPMKILLRSNIAAFCISAIGERELTTQTIMNYVVNALEPLQNVENEANYVELKDILCNSIAISSVLGSLCIVHASLTTLQMRSLFSETASTLSEFPDVFNYLNYSAWAVPAAILMFLANLAYEALLVLWYVGKKSISTNRKEELQKTFVDNKNDIGPMTYHEKISIFFLVLMLLCFFTRWSPWLGWGWATFRQYEGDPDLCGIKDATTAALFVMLLHGFPSSLNFLKIWTAKREGDLPQMKVESGVLYWKFVDKHTDYSLFLLIGAGSTLYKAMLSTDLIREIPGFCGDAITGLPWHLGILVVVLVSVLLGSVMHAMAAQACFMPLMLGMALGGKYKWPGRRNLVALAVGIGTALGFCLPFENTPCFYVNSVGKVPLKKQIRYSTMSSVICALVLWVCLCFAMEMWDPEDEGIFQVTLMEVPEFAAFTSTVSTTTNA